MNRFNLYQMGGLEHGGENNAEIRSDLEQFKGSPDAPFETVAKGEKTNDYPAAFTLKLKENWSKVCKLMGWEKSDKPVDWNFFKVAKDPFKVVTSIQEKLVSKGGLLPKYGVDGKFGSETLMGMTEVLSKLKKEEDKLELPPTQPEGVEESPDSKSENPEAEKELMRQKMREIMDASPKVDARLKAADLTLDEAWLGRPDLSEADVADYQTRAMQFREGLVAEEPKLEPLNRLANTLIPLLETDIKMIDLSNVKTLNDLEQVFTGLMTGMEAKVKTSFGVDQEKEAEKILMTLDVELVMSLFLSCLFELTVVACQHFMGDKENTERLGKLFKDELLLGSFGGQPDRPALGAEREVQVSVNPLPSAWLSLVEKGTISSGKIEFNSKGQDVVFDLDERRIAVGPKSAHLVIPEGVTLNSVQALPDGGMSLNAGFGGFATSQTVSRLELNSYLQKISTSNPGDKITIKEGIILEC